MFFRSWKLTTALLYSITLSLTDLVGVGGQTNRTEKDSTQERIQRFFYVALGVCIIGVIANSLLLLVIFKNPLRNLRKSSWLTISNLAFADFVTSASSIPMCLPELHDTGLKVDLTNVFYWFGYSASFFLLFLFAVEQFVAVKWPLGSRSILTKTRISLACIACWLLAITVGGLTWYKGSGKLYVFIAIFCPLEAVTVALIGLKVSILYHMQKRRRVFVLSERSERQAQTKEIVKTLLIIFFVLMVTALPYFVFFQMQFVHRMDAASLPNIFRVIPFYYFPVACLNFVVNPFIYAWRLRDYRCALAALFSNKRSQERPRPAGKTMRTRETVC